MAWCGKAGSVTVQSVTGEFNNRRVRQRFRNIYFWPLRCCLMKLMMVTLPVAGWGKVASIQTNEDCPSGTYVRKVSSFRVL